jgi:ABC-type lipoprotein release transport system permease subunit
MIDLIKLILNSQSGNLSKSTWKSMLGVAVGVTLMLFITSTLDSFIVNIEDYMLNFLPEIQFQRTKNAFPTHLKYRDAEGINALFSKDNTVLVSGAAFWERSIFQITTDTTHINKDILLFSGLIPDKNQSTPNNEYLLNIKPYLQSNEPIEYILKNDSNKVIISRRLQLKLFPNEPAIGKQLKIGLLKTESSKLTSVIVGGIYNNNSVNAIFVSRSSAISIMEKHDKALWANTYIVRLKNKYDSKEWRKKLLNNQTALRDKLKNDLDNTTDKNSDVYKQLSIDYEKIKSDIEFISPFQIQSWMDISPENLNYLKITRSIMLIIFSSILFLTTLSIKFLFDTIVIEKKRQIAILKTLGYSDIGVLNAFIMAGILIGAVGVLIGVMLGFFLNWTMGLLEQYYFEHNFSFQYINVLPSFMFTVYVSLLVMTLCAISALPSAWRVMKTKPIEGIKRDN